MRTTLRRSLHVGIALGAVSIAARLSMGLLSFGAGAATLEACSLTATDGGLLLKTQPKYTSSPVTQTSTGSFAGEIIRVSNQNGDVIVKGDPGATSVTVTATPFTRADNQDDANASLADVQGTIKIDQSQAGTISVTCAAAVQTHGSAQNGNSGCDGFTVTVPSGTAQSPLTITAHALNGNLTESGLTMSDSAVGQLHSDNGEVKVSVNGSVKADSGNGNVSATVIPNKGSVVEASSGNGDVTLGLPAAFSCDSLSLQAPSGTVTIGAGFSNTFTATSTSVGTAGTGAASVSASSPSLGNVTVQPSGA